MNILRLGARLQSGVGSRANTFKTQPMTSRNVSPSFGETKFAATPNVATENRLYSTDAKANKGTPIAHFPSETLLNGKGFTINPIKREDKSAFVGFVKPPKGHKESSEAALTLGLQTIYLQQNNNGDTSSVYTVNFDDSSPTLSMEAYIRDKQQRFNDTYPDGHFYPINLHSVVTEHLTKKNDVKCTAILFNPNGGPYSQALGKLVLFLSTPGGFWDIAWHTNISTLLDPKQIVGFTEAIKQLRIVWREGEGKESSSAQKVTTVTKKSLLP